MAGCDYCLLSSFPMTTTIPSSSSTPPFLAPVDLSSQYFFSNSDNPGSILVTCLLTGQENYPMWSRAMTNALNSQKQILFC